jgi:hypothetical protein
MLVLSVPRSGIVPRQQSGLPGMPIRLAGVRRSMTVRPNVVRGPPTCRMETGRRLSER